MFGKDNKPKTDESLLSEEGLDQFNPKEAISKTIIVRQMPKNYHSGTFSFDSYFRGDDGSEIKVKNGSKFNLSSRQMGVLIIIAGLALITGLVFVFINFFSAGSNKVKNFLSLDQLFSSVKPVNLQEQVVSPEIEFSIDPSRLASSTANNTNPATSSAPTSTPVLEATSTPEISSSTTETSEATIDSDSDGLSNIEEQALGTGINNPDTNANGYNDLTEVLNLYNPVGSGKLSKLASISAYINNKYRYSLLYLKAWATESLDLGTTVVFTALDQSFIQVVVQPNTKKESVQSWYETQFNQTVSSGQLYSWPRADAVRSADGLIFYLTEKTKKNIYIISYTPADLENPAYKTILEVMARSLMFN